MAYSFSSEYWKLPAGAFDPLPDQSMTLAINLVTVGVYIASSAILSVLSPLPRAVHTSDITIESAFGVALLLILIFGIGMIGIGWLVADNPTRYTALGRAMTRASHVVLIFVIALREAVTATTANTIKK